MSRKEPRAGPDDSIVKKNKETGEVVSCLVLCFVCDPKILRRDLRTSCHEKENKGKKERESSERAKLNMNLRKCLYKRPLVRDDLARAALAQTLRCTGKKVNNKNRKNCVMKDEEMKACIPDKLYV